MATKTQDDAIERVWRMLRDTGDTAVAQLLTNDEIAEVLEDALRTYSLARPRLITVDLVASGGDTTALPDSAAGWIEDFSSIQIVESPTGSNPPNYADSRSFDLYYAPPVQPDPPGETVIGSVLTIRWLMGAPVVSSSVRVTFTSVHVFGTTAAGTTVPDIDFGAVCALTASLCSVALSAGFAKTHEPLLSADTASYRTKSMEWAAVAKSWREVYDRHMASVRRPASGRVNWDTRLGGGQAHLTHDRWRR